MKEAKDFKDKNCIITITNNNQESNFASFRINDVESFFYKEL